MLFETCCNSVVETQLIENPWLTTLELIEISYTDDWK